MKYYFYCDFFFEKAQTPPVVNYEAEPDTLWSLLLTNPDGHLSQENAEYVHWFV